MESRALARPSLSEWLGRFLLGIGIAVPLAWVIGYSLLYSLGGIGLLSDGWTLRYWQRAISTGGLKESLVYSPLIAAVVTLIALTVSMVFVLVRPEARHSLMVLPLLCIPLGTPACVMAVMTYQVLSPGGLISRFAFHFGWLASPSQFPPRSDKR